MSMDLPQSTALIVIDVQRGFEDPHWGNRNNPDAEKNIARLIAHFRIKGQSILHVRHRSTSPTGSFRDGYVGQEVKPEAAELLDEPVYFKTVHSAFVGTKLEGDLRARGITSVVIAGITTNHCVSTTARMASDFGFKTVLVSDATAAFDQTTIDGTVRPAADVHMGALSDLSEEFATIAATKDIIT